MSDICDTQAAAKRIGLAASTLEKMRVHGGGPPYLKLGRAVRYRLQDIDAWLAKKVVDNTSVGIALSSRADRCN